MRQTIEHIFQLFYFTGAALENKLVYISVVNSGDQIAMLFDCNTNDRKAHLIRQLFQIILNRIVKQITFVLHKLVGQQLTQHGSQSFSVPRKLQEKVSRNRYQEVKFASLLNLQLDAVG